MKKHSLKIIGTSIVALIVLLTLLFIILKLFNLVTWSWLWILSPIWLGGGVIGLVLLLLSIYALCAINKDIDENLGD